MRIKSHRYVKGRNDSTGLVVDSYYGPHEIFVLSWTLGDSLCILPSVPPDSGGEVPTPSKIPSRWNRLHRHSTGLRLQWGVTSTISPSVLSYGRGWLTKTVGDTVFTVGRGLRMFVKK